LYHNQIIGHQGLVNGRQFVVTVTSRPLDQDRRALSVILIERTFVYSYCLVLYVYEKDELFGGN